MNQSFRVRYSPLSQQFSDTEAIFADLRVLVATGDFTLGRPVADFENKFATLVGRKHAIGVNSGTDALKLCLKALGIGPGDEIITAANTFIATIGAICELGARPVFVDCDDGFCMDPAGLEKAITPNTKAIMPVHLTGNVADLPRVIEIADRHRLPVIEDGCQSMLACLDGTPVGGWGIATGFSMHPLKVVNVWGDAGVIVTDDDAMNDKLRLLRNHGLRSREEVEILGCNTRLDSVQAVVGLHMIPKAEAEVDRRNENAAYYDRRFAKVSGIRVPPRRAGVRHAYLVYIVFAERRDDLYRFCLERGVEAKIHYPIPLYRQNALRPFGYKEGDFPVTDRHAREIITFPVDQFLTREQIDFVVDTVSEFYAAS